MPAIDLNADLGESFGVWRLGDDDAMLGIVTSANVACGFHAGDPAGLLGVCGSASERGVRIGARVSYHDLAGFGRRFIDVAPDDLVADVLYQIGALAAFCQASPTLKKAYDLVQDFLSMVHKREGARLDGWLEKIAKSGLAELESFASGIEKDKEAVRAGLTWPINNGQVEGQVTKLKLIKRQMYGRAAFDVLRQRVLARPSTSHGKCA